MLRSCPLAVLLLILLGVCAPRSAHATCGDWLQHAAPTQHVAAVNADMMDDKSSADGASSSVPAEPCHGPLCRQSPSGPGPLPASPSMERHHHDVAWMNQESSVVHARDAEWSVMEASFVPVGYKMGIERPPQSL